MQHVFIHRLDVRFRDCDALGHVNNATYFTYLEQARYAWLHEKMDAWRAGKTSMILARTECDFKAQVSHGETLEIQLRVDRIGRSSFDIEYAIIKVSDQQVVAKARSVQVMYNYVASKSIPIPTEIRRWLTDLKTLKNKNPKVL